MRELLMQTELMRLVASFKPLIAGAKISERILSIIKSIPNSQIPVQVRDFFFSDYHSCLIAGTKISKVMFLLIHMHLFEISGLSCDGKHASGFRKCCQCSF
jgi:hypothetical protein